MDRTIINIFDILVVLFFIGGLVLGLKKGFSEMFFNVIKNGAALFVSINYVYQITDIVKERLNFSYETSLCIFFSILFIVFYVGLTLLFYLIKKLVEIRFIEPVHSVLGALFGAADLLIILCALMFFFTFFPSRFFFQQIYTKSYSAGYIARGVVFLHKSIFSFSPANSHFDGERFMNEIQSRTGDEVPLKEKESEDEVKEDI
jgi:uncharacterized membrane protein required for colicin V production